MKAGRISHRWRKSPRHAEHGERAWLLETLSTTAQGIWRLRDGMPAREVRCSCGGLAVAA